MRNNVAIWLTGWDFGTYNSFHRWTARIATVEAIIHSVGYTIFVFRGPSTTTLGLKLHTLTRYLQTVDWTILWPNLRTGIGMREFW